MVEPLPLHYDRSRSSPNSASWSSSFAVLPTTFGPEQRTLLIWRWCVAYFLIAKKFTGRLDQILNEDLKVEFDWIPKLAFIQFSFKKREMQIVVIIIKQRKPKRVFSPILISFSQSCFDPILFFFFFWCAFHLSTVKKT